MYTVEVKVNNAQLTTISMRLDVDEYNKLKQAMIRGDSIPGASEYVTFYCSDVYDTEVTIEISRITVVVAQEDKND